VTSRPLSLAPAARPRPEILGAQHKNLALAVRGVEPDEIEVRKLFRQKLTPAPDFAHEPAAGREMLGRRVKSGIRILFAPDLLAG
jgi:hypothetical protein